MKDLYKELSDKRKDLQAQGLVPEWYTTSGFQLYSEKYEYKTDTSIKGQFERIAATAAKHLNHIGMEELAREKFFNLIWNGYLGLSTPVFANMGTDRGLPVSCSGGVIEDSIRGFYEARLETAVLTKNGFGTSSYLGGIRPRGSKISVGGKASGVLPVFKGFVQDMRDVAQGTARRGAWAGYIEIQHGDFDELADYIMSEPDDANIGWIVNNDFLDGLASGNEDYIRRYQKVLKIKMVVGKGYFYFIDKVNAKRPQMYQDKNLLIKASNLCVTGDTIVSIKFNDVEMNVPIVDIEKMLDDNIPILTKSYNIETGSQEWKPITDFALTKKKAKLLKITDEKTGKSIKCTPCHRIYTKNRGYVEAGNLNPDDELEIN